MATQQPSSSNSTTHTTSNPTPSTPAHRPTLDRNLSSFTFFPIQGIPSVPTTRHNKPQRPQTARAQTDSVNPQDGVQSIASGSGSGRGRDSGASSTQTQTEAPTASTSTKPKRPFLDRALSSFTFYPVRGIPSTSTGEKEKQPVISRSQSAAEGSGGQGGGN